LETTNSIEHEFMLKTPTNIVIKSLPVNQRDATNDHTTLVEVSGNHNRNFITFSEPSHKLHKFCKFNQRKMKVTASLSRFYHDNDSEDSGAEDDEEIHNPNLPYITKREMRYYIFNFGNELFKNGLIQRLNEDNKQWKSSEQYAAANKKWIELDLINNLLGISLSDREY
jgi:hypothetical protein